MTRDELNSYILNYIEEDKTKSAIMLTGDWGSGKSYYINHDLLPFVNKESNRCVVVSLYGLKEISELSKCIYFEIRFKKFQNAKEGSIATKLIAKTVAKGVTSLCGIDLSASENALQELYESIDLSGKLIILEDIERSGINILELLGYVNNLVEQDGVKVLLVANEDEILEYEDNKDSDQTNKVLTKESLAYLRTKEKTISDTLVFRSNYLSAIKNIIAEFENSELSAFLEDEYVNDICDLFALSQNTNLRSFIYACQKTSDIFKLSRNKLDFDTKRNIFYSIIVFAKRLKSGQYPKWEGTEYLSTSLGFNSFPLYRFCYDYIVYHVFENEDIVKTIEEHKKLKMYQEHRTDNDVNTLSNYFIYTEEEVLTAIKNIEDKLDYPDTISFNNYSKIAFYLVICHDILGADYSVLKRKMISNILKYGDDIDGTMLFLGFDVFNNENQEKLFQEFKEDILRAIKEKQEIEISISYSPEDIEDIHQIVKNNSYEIRKKQRFLCDYDIDNLVIMLFECNSEQLYCFRKTLYEVYKNTGKGDFVKDIGFLRQLKNIIDISLETSIEIKDRILIQQFKWLLGDIQKYISQLS